MYADSVIKSRLQLELQQQDILTVVNLCALVGGRRQKVTYDADKRPDGRMSGALSQAGETIERFQRVQLPHMSRKRKYY